MAQESSEGTLSRFLTGEVLRAWLREGIVAVILGGVIASKLARTPFDWEYRFNYYCPNIFEVLTYSAVGLVALFFAPFTSTRVALVLFLLGWGDFWYAALDGAGSFHPHLTKLLPGHQELRELLRNLIGAAGLSMIALSIAALMVRKKESVGCRNEPGTAGFREIGRPQSGRGFPPDGTP